MKLLLPAAVPGVINITSYAKVIAGKNCKPTMLKYMKRLIQGAILILICFTACKKQDQKNPMQARFQLDPRLSSVDGNLIMGQPANKTNTFTLVFKNASAGMNTTITADTVNGLYISPATVSLSGDSVKV